MRAETSAQTARATSNIQLSDRLGVDMLDVASAPSWKPTVKGLGLKRASCTLLNLRALVAETEGALSELKEESRDLRASLIEDSEGFMGFMREIFGSPRMEANSERLSEVVEAIPTLSRQLKDLQQQTSRLQTTLHSLQCISERFAKEPLTKKLSVDELSALSAGYASSCSEVVSVFLKILPTACSIPGFYTTLAESGCMLPEECHLQGIRLLVFQALNGRTTEERLRGFTLLWRLEKEAPGSSLEISRPLYQRALKDPLPEVRCSALAAMCEEQRLRPEPFAEVIAGLLEDKFSMVRLAAIKAAQKTIYPSSQINRGLRRIELLGAPEEKTFAKEALASRQQKNLYQPVSLQSVMKAVLSGFIADTTVQEQLNVLVQAHLEKELRMRNRNATLLHMVGDPGIGKTLLAARLGDALFHEKSAQIRIDLSQTQAAKDLGSLRQRGGDYSARLIFFDELQALDGKDPAAAQSIIEAIIPLFEASASNVNVDGSVVITASNVPLAELNSFGAGPGAKLRELIEEKSSQVALAADLSAQADQIVDGFSANRFYEKEFPKLGNVQLDEAARKVLKADLNERYASRARALSGRQAVAYIARAVNLAKSTFEEAHGPLELDEMGRVRGRLSVTAKDGELCLSC